MFTKSKTPTFEIPTTAGGAAKPAPSKPVPPSIIAADMRVLGDLETEGDVQIDGRVDGDLHIRSVTVGKGAVVNGAIFGETVKIAGTVNGEIRGTEVTLAASACVVGDVHHKTLSVDAGAFLQGLCKRIRQEGPLEGAVDTSHDKSENGQGRKV